MTYQEVLWQGRFVLVTGIMSKSGKCHNFVRKYVGRGGMVKGEAKNGMLLIKFKHGQERAIPAGCVTPYAFVSYAKSNKGNQNV